MAVRIIIDSGSDIVDLKRDDLTILPLTVAFGETLYRDGVDLTHHDFYRLLVEDKGLPTTGQVTPYAFKQAFEAAAAAGEEVVVITLSSELSGTHQSALTAAGDCDGVVHVVDSQHVSVGVRVLVERALALADEGATAAEIAAAIEDLKGRLCFFALLDTLEYLRRGGRISNAKSFVGTMLKVKPIVSVIEGKVVMLDRARGIKAARARLNELIVESGGIDFDAPYALGYSGITDDMLRAYVEESQAIWGCEADELPSYTIGGTIGTHAGPGAVLIAYFARG